MVTDLLPAAKGEVRLGINWNKGKENPNLANLMTCLIFACGGMILCSLFMEVE